MSNTSTEMRVTSKGQVTIPKAIRDVLGIREGTEIAFREDGGRFYLEKVQGLEFWLDRIEQVAGTADAGLSTAEIMRMTRGEDWDDRSPKDVAG